MTNEDAELTTAATAWQRARQALRLPHVATTPTDELWEVWTLIDEVYDRLAACNIALGDHRCQRIDVARERLSQAQQVLQQAITEIEAIK